jgi:transcriptional regulator with XRE-family HTH domain
MSRPKDAREARERKFMSELGQRLRAIREERGLTQREAAEAAQVATDMISRLENGHYTSPGLRTLLRVAEGLGTTVGDLLPDGTPTHSPAALSQRARLNALMHRAKVEDLELIAEIAQTVIQRSRG